MTEPTFEEIPMQAVDTVDRSWRRVFEVNNIIAMVTQGAKHKAFRPDTVIIEFAQRNDESPVLRKVVFRGPFLSAEGSGQRVFNRRDLEDLTPYMRTRIDAIVEEVAGSPSRESIFAKMARRANGWTTDPFTDEEEELWQTFETIRAGLTRA